ncbi:peptide deformylase, mitochondrial [Manduca sexta]|uniref:peptide deformylase, mitochondrial n=1 Tax=Manduca sexta TaxID=7130 RepID=UPI00188EB26A|nr:peptide deformylase, mitochondrial [Manduca sexta]
MGVTRKFLNWYARLSPARGKSTPPYQHVIQIGDPTLRKVCEPVPVDKIKTKEVQTVIQKLTFVVNKYEAFGMSAPQIGINMRIFVMQHTAKQLSRVPKVNAQMMGLITVPFTVFVNPTLKVLNYQKVVRAEGCESVQGYTAEVPRYKEVQITGYDQDGEPLSRTYKDWTARIAQHEMDHLDGKLYVDIMDKKTLTCICWEEVNLSKGKVVIPFSP